jgi:hypothetical protein
MARLEPYVQVTEVIKDFPTLLSIDGSANIGCTIVSAVGPRLQFIDGPNTFLKNYTKDGVTIPRNAHISFINAYYLSFFAGLVVARSMNSTATGGVRVYLKPATTGEGATPEQIKTYRTFFKDGVELTKVFRLGLSNFPANHNWGIVIDEVIYYGGDLETVLAGFTADGQPVDLSGLDKVCCDDLYDETLTESYGIQCQDFLVSELNKLDVYTVVREASGVSFYKDEQTEDPVVDKVDLLNDDGELVTKTITPVGVTVTVPAASVAPQGIANIGENEIKLFTIMDKTPGSVNDNPNKVSISKTRILAGRKVFDITLQNGVNDPETYVVSLDKEAVDSSEVNCFIEELNAYAGLEFTIIAEEGLEDQTWTAKLQNATFGEGFVDEAICATSPYLKQSLDTLEDQEQFKIAYLAPVGITIASYIKTYTSMGRRNKWFCPVDVPYDRTNYNSIAAYGNLIDDDYNVYMCGPFDKNGGLTGWIVYIAATTLYYERVMMNRSMQSEFAPVFDKQTGLMNYTNPVKLLKKSAREKLISLIKPINYVIFDQNTQAYYMNDNWTHYSLSENIMGEENCVRLVHKISRDLHDLYQQFKAKFNNEQTRQAVIDVTNLYFQSQIMNQNFAPAEYMIICDRTNNTDAVLQARQLAVTVKVRLYKSIKYILVLNEVYSVGGAAFTA